MDGFRTHLPGEDVVDLLARHGGHGKARALRDRAQPVVALRVVEDQRALRAGDLDPGPAIVRIGRRQVPSAADHDEHAVVHRHRRPHAVVGAVDLLHVAVGALTVDAHGLCRLQEPEHEVEVVGRFHGGGRELDALGDLLAEAARQVPADHDVDDAPEGSVLDLLLGVGDLGVEALGIADGELHALALGGLDQLVRFPELHGDWLFQEDVLAGPQTVARDREMRRFRRRRDIDHLDRVVAQNVLIIGRGSRRVDEGSHLGEALLADLADVQLVDEGRARQSFGADSAAPARSDHGNFHGAHVTSFSFEQSRERQNVRT